MVATELLKLAMETDEERKARLKKMVATTQLRLAPETEDERRTRLEYLSGNPIYIPNNLYLILIVSVGQTILSHLCVWAGELGNWVCLHRRWSLLLPSGEAWGIFFPGIFPAAW